MCSQQNKYIKMKWCCVLLCCVITIRLSFGARILGVVSTPSYSHQTVFFPIWRELSLRGHQVTLITTDPLNDPSLTNLTEIDCHFSYKTLLERINMNEIAEVSPWKMLERFESSMHDVVEEQFQHPMVQNLLKNETKHFDIVIIEGRFPAAATFAERFDCPLIQMLSIDLFQYLYHKMGNPSNPVLNPEYAASLIGKLNFFERLKSVVYSLILDYHVMSVINSQSAVSKKIFGNHYPALDETLSKTSLWFVNTDTVFHPIRPLLPNIIQIGGGTHLKPPKPLPKDLQNVLDNASNGFIYFSLGSNIKSKFLSEERRAVLLESFAELPYTILWKFEEEDLPGKPKNVIISKWFPQQDVFRHPNIKLFLTQGGLQSVEEAMYNHIPIIGMPFFADQQYNIKRVVYKGMGLSIDFTTMDKDTLKGTILEVINNPKYRNRVKKLAELSRDQPMTGLERAVWWTEYVIRHKGAKHLRSPAIDLPLYQYYLLDVVGFCLLVFLIVVYVLVKLVMVLYKLFKSLIKPKSKVE